MTQHPTPQPRPHLGEPWVRSKQGTFHTDSEVKGERPCKAWEGEGSQLALRTEERCPELPGLHVSPADPS